MRELVTTVLEVGGAVTVAVGVFVLAGLGWALVATGGLMVGMSWALSGAPGLRRRKT